MLMLLKSKLRLLPPVSATLFMAFKIFAADDHENFFEKYQSKPDSTSTMIHLANDIRILSDNGENLKRLSDIKEKYNRHGHKLSFPKVQVVRFAINGLMNPLRREITLEILHEWVLDARPIRSYLNPAIRPSIFIRDGQFLTTDKFFKWARFVWDDDNEAVKGLINREYWLLSDFSHIDPKKLSVEIGQYLTNYASPEAIDFLQHVNRQVFQLPLSHDEGVSKTTPSAPRLTPQQPGKTSSRSLVPLLLDAPIHRMKQLDDDADKTLIYGRFLSFLIEMPEDTVNLQLSIREALSQIKLLKNFDTVEFDEFIKLNKEKLSTVKINALQKEILSGVLPSPQGARKTLQQLVAAARIATTKDKKTVKRRKNLQTNARHKQLSDRLKDLDEVLQNLESPQALIDHLDTVIIGQDRAKKMISFAIFDHYKRLRYNLLQELGEIKTDDDGDISEPESDSDSILSDALADYKEGNIGWGGGRSFDSESTTATPEEFAESARGAKTLSKQKTTPMDQSPTPPEAGVKFIAAAAPDEDLEDDDPEVGLPSVVKKLKKQNLLLVGPSGSGKTRMMQLISEKTGIPIYFADATRYTSQGYIGGNVESIVTELFNAAGRSAKKAALGIVFIDEFDKLRKKESVKGRDIIGRVQMELLKLIEGTQESIEYGNKVDTKDILFVFAGAFSDLTMPEAEHKDYEDELLDKVVRYHQKVSHFAHVESIKEHIRPLDIKMDFEPQARVITSKDLHNYGMMPEIIGRIGSIVNLEPLTTDILERILLESTDSILAQYKTMFEADGVYLSVRKSGVRKIAELASLSGSGARGIEQVLVGLGAMRIDKDVREQGSLRVDCALIESLNPGLSEKSTEKAAEKARIEHLVSEMERHIEKEGNPDHTSVHHMYT